MALPSGVAPAAAGDQAIAAELAQRLDLPLFEPGADARRLPEGQLLLTVCEGRAALQQTGRRAPGPVVVSFEDPALVHRRRGGQNELLGRAVGWRRDRAPAVLDATAGFGRDAFVLADLGCPVLLCERETVMALLLERALVDGGAATAAIRDACARMRLHAGDARELPLAALRGIDVIYLDPMFAAPRRGAVGKAMQALQLLTAGDASAAAEAGELLRWARGCPVRRVVVKRPRRAPALGGAAPSHVLQGRAVRFDVYAIERQQGDSDD